MGRVANTRPQNAQALLAGININRLKKQKSDGVYHRGPSYHRVIFVTEKEMWNKV